MRKSNSNKTMYSVLMLVCIVVFWAFENFYTPDTYSSKDSNGLKEALPAYVVPSSTTGDIVEHSYYSLSYNEPYEQAEWVAYALHKKDLTSDDRKRPYFIEDPKVKTKSADWRNYKGSGYDRGHLCPAGDRRFSKQAYNETFYTSNISPQNRDFNAGVWNILEMKTRYWAKKYGSIFVITGGILKRGLPEIGDEDVAVPNYFYKIIARGDEKNLKAVAFIMENKESSAPIKEFLVPIDVIEKETGIDFFKELSEKNQSKIEAKVSDRDWKF
ncbi:DNA/RNA non-specific endonuclease [uncultured Maribacter sp.]|uniref:DNA/RNA non-specific endonuclease n=1 Tax=uncultured Maribacter sp. TaxID=431308 RepID=UPI002632D244|nr:DNA/RNA non-specific endonuclease [uncultured Maribacter sp.]